MASALSALPGFNAWQTLHWVFEGYYADEVAQKSVVQNPCFEKPDRQLNVSSLQAFSTQPPLG
jgi:hypothetical protein